MKIDVFRGKYFFLSNFYDVCVSFNGLTFQNSECAFQAQKTLDVTAQEKFTKLKASEGKKAGYHVPLRPDWESVKDKIMYDVVKSKFQQNPDLKKLLLATGNADLEEGNTWNDRYWGTVNGQGKNVLGKTLMAVRAQLLKEEDSAYIYQIQIIKNDENKSSVKNYSGKLFTPDMVENVFKNLVISDSMNYEEVPKTMCIQKMPLNQLSEQLNIIQELYHAYIQFGDFHLDYSLTRIPAETFFEPVAENVYGKINDDFAFNYQSEYINPDGEMLFDEFCSDMKALLN